MYKFRFFLVSFLFLTCTLFSQNNKVFIKSEKVLYKSTEQGDLNLYFYRPLDFDDSKAYNCIIFFHGGGWNSGDYKQFERQSMYFASRGMVAISAEYRIKNKHGTSPINAMEDAKSAIRFLRLNSKSFSINPDRIAAAGGSAGGHLAAVTANINLFDNKNEDLNVSSKPNLLILYNPVIDFGSRKWLWINNPSNASPIHNIKEGSPATIILSGTEDKIVPFETIINYKKIMESVGSRCDIILYEGAEHAFFNRGNDFIDTVFQSDIFLRSNWYLSGEPTIKEQYQ
ncbi:MAG: alpha/beta hydrolase fold domain-containing protein [Flavobacteriaceae bacterium]|nr:alpha/beta hydrolase fold domain-containing protein [Flavobacteriaceae bacterium]|tara:strand:- start:2418 stop:3272 length:855 start_codon:yes stop_codon:yes gene_type:complete